ncbi:hypothetical protein [Acidithrix sp. C25]|uniref:hypothetical protein n=1 Tax=Acidithrix sp. C25 TaxID=1671482 RepID=UPI00191B96C5|nr:hypothetical protein [Acidithrix sp. C25]
MGGGYQITASRQIGRWRGVILQAHKPDDERIGAICYPTSPDPMSNEEVVPDGDAIIAELSKSNLSPQKLLFDEYCEKYQKRPSGYRQFCEFIPQVLALWGYTYFT